MPEMTLSLTSDINSDEKGSEESAEWALWFNDKSVKKEKNI